MINYIGYAAVHEDLDSPNMDNVIAGLIDGTWNEGLAATGTKIGGMAYANPPASLKNYFRSEFANNILNNPVQAQSSGDSFLDPVRDAWNGMRNLAYGFFTIIMVALGLGIIFQQQLPTRTVVTFTYALPKILFGLVLITFSYPIVALFIDLGFNFLSAVITQVFASDIFSGVSATLGGGAASSLSGSLLSVLGYFLQSVGLSITDPLGSVVVAAIAMLVFLVVVGLLIIRFVVASAWLFVYTVFSPLIFLFGTLPGQEGAITDFLKQISAKVLVFPVMLFLIGLAGFVSATTALDAQQSIFSGDYQTYALGQYAGTIGPYVGIAILAAAISVPGMIEEALGVGRKKK
ncbi:MAG: hypothetical protein WEC39_02115 [Patescibacteria group bacterium]